MSENLTIDGNTNKGLTLTTLKYIAIAAMLIDHIAVTFVAYDSVLFLIMDLIGRITGPVMFFAAVEGYHHTKSFQKYLLRLFLFAWISYFPFSFLFTKGEFDPLFFNILFNIFLGLLAVHIFRTVKNIFLKSILILALLLLSIPMDYGTLCITIMLVLDFFYGDRKNQLAGYLIVILLETDILNFFLVPMRSFLFEHTFDVSYSLEAFRDFGFLIPFFLLWFYKGEKGKSTPFSKWVFYAFYPAHLILLCAIYLLLSAR